MPQVLEDITVLDLSSGWAGSVATMILADFGADVIKVEPPEGDPYREWPQSKLWNRGRSRGVEMISISLMPANIRTVSG